MSAILPSWKKWTSLLLMIFFGRQAHSLQGYCETLATKSRPMQRYEILGTPTGFLLKPPFLLPKDSSSHQQLKFKPTEVSKLFPARLSYHWQDSGPATYISTWLEIHSPTTITKMSNGQSANFSGEISIHTDNFGQSKGPQKIEKVDVKSGVNCSLAP